MKTSIIIAGSGISSKLTLVHACVTAKSEVKLLDFNNYEIQFETKKEAVKALSEAYQYLKSDKDDWDASCGSYQCGYSLSYDAGKAKIIQTQI